MCGAGSTRESERALPPQASRGCAEAPSRTRFFVGTVGRNRHVLTAHPCAFAKKSPTGESPSRHPSTRTDENEPAGLFSAFRPERGWAGGAAATPNPAQKPRRGRRVSVPRPSRSLSRCEHTRINPHPPSPAIRPRGGAEAAHPFAHSRGKRRGAFAPPCGLPTPLALASAARPRRRRNASRHVASSTSARDDHHPPFAASIPRLTILPPLAFPPRRDTRPR